MTNLTADITTVNKLYRYMRNDMPIETFRERYGLSELEIKGIVELCNAYGKNISIEFKDGVAVFKKVPYRVNTVLKPGINDEELIHVQIGVVSDTHFGNVHQQMHLLNDFYQEAYNRGINLVIHCGDVVDGNYTIRQEQPRQQFLHGFDEQAGYVVDMYPKVSGITTKFILGSHDETHYKNDQATIGEWIPRCRKDMIYLGQDTANILLENVIRLVADHPGDGKAKGESYSIQNRIEVLESGYKPHILLVGHYHGNYEFEHRNVRGIMAPSFCAETQFQHKKALRNSVGGYFLDIYADKKGNIQYFEADEMSWKQKDFWDEAGKDKGRVKQLVIDKAQ